MSSAVVVECMDEDATSIKWRKGDLIGSGAFGRVYRAMNTESGELIAVKEAHTGVLQEEVRLLENLSHPKIVRYLGTEKEDETLTMLLEYVPGGSVQSLLEKFGSFSLPAHTGVLQEEVRLLENLSHPKIVRYLGTEKEDETLTMLLEYVPGGSVQSLLEKFGSFSLPVIKRYTKQLLLALEYLHKQGIIHGDIKGANILVGSKGRIKLADFGTSRQSAISGAKPTRGTPYWMAPEVIRGTGHDFSADIWSVGCTVIEMATGNPPWSQQFETIAAFFYYIGTTKSHPPIPEHLSSSAKDFLLECLQKEPTARPSASQLLKHPFLTGREALSQNISNSSVMEVEVASSVCESDSDETDIMSDKDANFKSNVSNPTGYRSRNLFTKISKFFKSSSTRRMKPEKEGELSFASIKVATQNFCEKNKIGEGGFGSVYKGKLVNGQDVAVKRLSIPNSTCEGDLQFNNEWRLIHELQHRNIIRLLGHCAHGAERVLVYEYMVNGSLYSNLFGSSSDLLLDWKKRFSIIEGIAQAMVYFQKYSRVRVIHRDIKTSNILLDAQMNPKIADFGLAISIADDEEKVVADCLAGTVGYMAPENIYRGILSTKTDVFSYGVVMLEIISGKKNCSAEGICFVERAWKLWEKGAGLELADPRLDASSINEDQLLRCIHVGLLCTEGNEDNRPTMSEVISMLPNERVPLPKPVEPGYPRHGNKPETMFINGSSMFGQSIDNTINNSSAIDHDTY